MRAVCVVVYECVGVLLGERVSEEMTRISHRNGALVASRASHDDCYPALMDGLRSQRRRRLPTLIQFEPPQGPLQSYLCSKSSISLSLTSFVGDL